MTRGGRGAGAPASGVPTPPLDGADVVTDIAREGKVVRVTWNGAETRALSRRIFRMFPLQTGDRSELAAWRAWADAQERAEALARAVAALAAQPRCAAEIARGLTARGYAPEIVMSAVERLMRERLLDDAAFARGYIESRRRALIGDRRIAYELNHKGVARGIADAAFAALKAEDEEAAARAAEAEASAETGAGVDGMPLFAPDDPPVLTLARKLWRRHAREDDRRRAFKKCLDAMARRGFAFDDALRALKTARAEAEDADVDRDADTDSHDDSSDDAEGDGWET